MMQYPATPVVNKINNHPFDYYSLGSEYSTVEISLSQRVNLIESITVECLSDEMVSFFFTVDLTESS